MSTDQLSSTSRQASIALVQQLKEFYQEYDINALSSLSDIYTQDVEFVDPVESIHGILALKNYLRRQGAGLNYGRFEYVNELVGDNMAYIRWKMIFSHPKLAGGKELVLPGVSEIHFTNRVYYQQDSYDLGAMLYEHLPLMGWAIRKLKKRMAGH